MKNHPKVSKSLVFLLAASSGLAVANNGNVQTKAEPINNRPAQLWFVELVGKPVAAQKTTAMAARSSVMREQDSVRNRATQAGIAYRERFAFNTLWNGFSVAADNANIGKMATLPGVKAVYPVFNVALPKIPKSATKGKNASLDMASALAMTGADIVQNSLGYTGQGVKVGVIDTGIDYDHPDLGGGCFGAGCKVIGGYDFVGDAYDAGTNPNPVEDGDPDDCNGHGTHVAGIVGATGAVKVKGVAPAASLAAYRVFGCDGSTSTDIMIKAMERAYADGMQVVNMSIGSSFQYPDYPSATAADNLVARGVTVAVSAGNSGTSGLFAAGAPSVGRNVISTASFENTQITQPAFKAFETANAANNQLVGFNPAAGAPLATDSTAPLLRTGTTASTTDACSALPAGSLTGAVALIRRGGCLFYTKAINAQNAGAVGVVIYNNVSGGFNVTVAGAPAVTVPVATITSTDGTALDARIVAGGTSMTWDKMLTASNPNPLGGTISYFSSFGLSYTLDLKPDLGAPGGSIYSTFPIERGSYASLNGTSMAAPHIAGAAALLLEAKPGTLPDMVKTRLINSADPALQPGSASLDNVHRQGGGLLDIDDAILAKTLVKPNRIALGEGRATPFVQYVQIENQNATAATYDLANAPALASSGVLFTAATAEHNLANFATVVFNTPTVTVPAGGKVLVRATITPPVTPLKGIYGGYITVSQHEAAPAQAGSQQAITGPVFRVPYAGFIGDYQAVTVLAPTIYNLPCLAKESGGFLYCQAASPAPVFTMSGSDIPWAVYHLDYAAKAFNLQVFKEDNTLLGSILKTNGYGSNSSADGAFVFSWDGTINSSAVADGNYKFKLTVLKPLGNASKPAESETWTSPVFTINRAIP